ncbi:MAG: hypothetical protein RR678_11635 [Lachnospiraceae bacterium]
MPTVLASSGDALTTALTSIAGEMTGTIASVAPIALAIVGGVMVITFGVAIFKKLTGSKNC